MDDEENVENEKRLKKEDYRAMYSVPQTAV
jgi:hypothetical protein